MLFVYFFVLPWTLQFFIAFTITVPSSHADAAPKFVTATTQPVPGTTVIPVVKERPREVVDGQIWYDEVNKRIEMALGGQIRVIRFSADNLIATEYSLDKYITLVVGMLITFGLSFQLPLVVLALVRTNIVERETLKASRQYVYFGIAILAAVITPGDYITGTVLLIFPLILLYELGLWLAREPKPQKG
jgi:Sec-independent protein secretion pathway component TatC